MADTLSNPTVVKLKAIAKRLSAVAIVDAPESFDEAKKFRAANGDERIYLISPGVKVSDGDTLKSTPASAYAAAIFARINFWQSPSNQELEGILGSSVPVSFALDDPASQGQLLNGSQIATIVRQDGLRLWGVNGSGDQTDLTSNQIQKVRIRDAIKEALLSSIRWAIALGITKDFFTAVSSKVNEFLGDLQRKGAILGGECFPDDDQNTPGNLSSGKAFFVYRFTPISVAETLTFTEDVTDEYFRKLGV